MPIRVVFIKAIVLALGAALLSGCSTTPPRSYPPLALATKVDLARFAGEWFVIANIPTFVEVGAHNAKEAYVLLPDGAMDTTFSYNADAFDGPLRVYRSKGYILDENHAIWGQQYLWPFKADYRIGYLADDYSQVIVAREKRDYVWILARTPTISEADYQRLLGLIGAQGYDVTKVQRVPQRGS